MSTKTMSFALKDIALFAFIKQNPPQTVTHHSAVSQFIKYLSCYSSCTHTGRKMENKKEREKSKKCDEILVICQSIFPIMYTAMRGRTSSSWDQMNNEEIRNKWKKTIQKTRWNNANTLDCGCKSFFPIMRTAICGEFPSSLWKKRIKLMNCMWIVVWGLDVVYFGLPKKELCTTWITESWFRELIGLCCSFDCYIIKKVMKNCLWEMRKKRNQKGKNENPRQYFCAAFCKQSRVLI